MIDVGTLTQNQLDLATGGGIEARAKPDQTLDDGGMGVSLDGVMDVGTTGAGHQAVRESVELTLDRIDVHDQRRMREIMGGNVGRDARGGEFDGGCRDEGRTAKAGYCVHGHLQ